MSRKRRCSYETGRCRVAVKITARLSCFLKFDVNESSFSGSKVELQAASFDLLVYSVEGLTKRGGESGRGVENIGKLGAEEPGMGAGEEQRDA